MPSSFLINYQQVRPSFLLRGNSRGARSQSELGKICWTPFPAPGPGDLELNKMPLLGCFRKQPHYRPLSPDPFLTSQQCHLHGPFSLVIWRPCPQGWAREDTGLSPWSQDTLQRPDAPGLKGGYFKQGGQERAFEEKPAGNPGASHRDSSRRAFRKEGLADAQTLGKKHGWRAEGEQQVGHNGQSRVGESREVTKRSKRWSGPGHTGDSKPF